jgi:endoglucanase
MKQPITAWVLTLTCLFSLPTLAEPPPAFGHNTPLIHMNVVGPGFNPEVLPGRPNFNYVFPEPDYLDRWKTRGIRVVRFSILWERLQPTLNGPFDADYAAGIDDFLKQAADRDMGVILDIHNYGRYRQQVIGTHAIPLSSYKNLLQQVSERWHAAPGLLGYDIMNEPFGDADKHWPAAAQAAIDGVRAFDSVKPIYVEGRSWSSAVHWPELNSDLLALKDPANNLIFSAHMYLDEGSKGIYPTGPGEHFDLNTGVDRARPFVEWLARNHRRGQFGEFGVAADDPRWMQAMDRLLAYLKTQCVPLAYWAAGPLWGNYPLSIEPQNGVDRPQWATVARYVRATNTCQ